MRDVEFLMKAGKLSPLGLKIVPQRRRGCRLGSIQRREESALQYKKAH
jgi:hypothetical protein